jgi:hypothetical protein
LKQKPGFVNIYSNDGDRVERGAKEGQAKKGGGPRVILLFPIVVALRKQPVQTGAHFDRGDRIAKKVRRRQQQAVQLVGHRKVARGVQLCRNIKQIGDKDAEEREFRQNHHAAEQKHKHEQCGVRRPRHGVRETGFRADGIFIYIF